MFGDPPTTVGPNPNKVKILDLDIVADLETFQQEARNCKSILVWTWLGLPLSVGINHVGVRIVARSSMSHDMKKSLSIRLTAVKDILRMSAPTCIRKVG
ncbi:hypothetical protein C8J56DRAFT_1032256 [Mycena floridula]|nr:hypothetical protein C8J56DRAFT_1032256 [Mycena floridula]